MEIRLNREEKRVNFWRGQRKKCFELEPLAEIFPKVVIRLGFVLKPGR